MLLAVLIALIVGLVLGIFPARRAAGLDPVDFFRFDWTVTQSRIPLNRRNFSELDAGPGMPQRLASRSE